MVRARVAIGVVIVLTVASWVGAASPARAPVRSEPRTPTSAPTTQAWGQQTDGEMQKSVAALKSEMAKRFATEKMRMPLMAETKFFLLYSDISATECNRWAQSLDEMYASLCNIFGIEKGRNIWRGKCVIVVFQNRGDYNKFEKAQYNFAEPEHTGGLCHSFPDGRVEIDFYVAADPRWFKEVLTHETTHGFVFRYRASTRVPSWVNEGLADTVAFDAAVHAGLRQSADAKARTRLREPAAFKDFFETKRIENDQYGIARTLTEFMIRQSRERYVAFFNGIKDGMGWEQSLNEKYGVSKEKLVAAYGNEMGVPGLKP